LRVDQGPSLATRAEQTPNQTIAAQLGGYWEAEYQVRFPASGGRASGTLTEAVPKPEIRIFNPARGLLSAIVQ
ncbi:MAG: hypothetical protein ABL949_17415, partial [Fimbriimonadaceae bacterium]